MSSTPQRSETHDVDLTREQRWVVHHVLVCRADAILEAEERPPTWLVDLFERVEDGADSITDRQARRLVDALGSYASADETPDRDTETASSVVAELEAALE